MLWADVFETAHLLIWFLSAYFLLIIVRRLYEIVTSSKKDGLPRPTANNILLYFRLIYFAFRSDTIIKKAAVLHWISSFAFLHKKAGLVHLRFLVLDLVFLFNPTTVQPLLQSWSNVDKPMFYHFFKEWLGSSVFLSNGDEWRKKRKILLPTFHRKILDNFIPAVEKWSQLLVEELSRLGQNGPVDIAPLLADCVLKILCETVMGLPTEGSECEFSTIGEHMTKVTSIIEERFYAVWKWPDVIFHLTPSGRKFRRSVEALKKITDQIIEEKISQIRTEESKHFSEVNQTGKPLALLDILLRSLSNGSDLTLEDVGEEVRLFLFAGEDTTSLTLIWTLYLLGKHTDVQRRLQEEVDNVTGDDSDKLLNKNDLYHLKYTDCVIKEAMRLYPAVPLIARRTSDDILIGNYKIPKGFTCIISIQDIHLDPDIYPCPNKFDPERFLPENCVGRHPCAFIPFAAGPRNCIGQKFAMIEVKIILARLMQKFTFRSLDQNVQKKYLTTLHPVGPVRLQVQKRY